MNVLRLRLTACGVTALLVLLVPLAAAEGEYWKEPDTITFPGGGSVAAGRVENLLEQDGRTMKLSDTAIPVGAIYTVEVPPTIGNNTEEWDAHPDTSACQDIPPTLEYQCFDEPLPGDAFSTYADTGLNNTEESVIGYLWGEKESTGDSIDLIQIRMRLRSDVPAADVVYVSVVLNPTWLTGNPPCAQTFIFPSNGTWTTYSLFTVDPNCLGDGTLFLSLTYHCENCTGTVSLTTVAFKGFFTRLLRPHLHADLSLGATGYYPIRAEWTCTARTGGPYYLGALNATGGTRWFNVTRDAGGSYPSGEMCAVPGATERYHAAMTAADFGADGRVHFRIADNASDPSGSAWGNVTLDRLVAILTQDFGVSVGNLGWLVYLGFITVGILIAAFAYHRWREHGSGA